MKIKYFFTLKDNTETGIEIAINKEHFLSGKENFNIIIERLSSSVIYSTTEMQSEIIREFEELIRELDEFFSIRIIDLETEAEILHLNNASMTISAIFNADGNLIKKVSVVSYN